LWANQNDAKKNDLQIELFLFSKNYTPYFMPIKGDVEQQLRPLFLFDYINQVNLGAGTGLSVRDYELSESEDNVLLRTDLEKVGRAETLIHLIEHERHDIVEFSETEHEFKRMKGIVARFTDPNNPDATFYTVKLIQQGQTLKSALAWEFSDGKFGSFNAEVGFKVGYEYKKQVIADKKVAEIEKEYKLSFPEGMDLNALVKERKKTINKLQKLEIGAVKQEDVLDYADEMQLELMSDDNGAIIIMDGNDLDMFVNLINEDYIESKITGKRYEIKSKKLLGEPEGEPPRG